MIAFPTTRWSVVLTAGEHSSASAQAALEHLCRIYWYPLYAYARVQGAGPHDAEDLVQGFFAELIEKNLVAKARSEKGRFRAFLLGSFENHCARQRERKGAAKRGGHTEIISLDGLRAEDRFIGAMPSASEAGQRFEHEWAVAMLDEALKRLAAECAAAGRQRVFDRLQRHLQITATRAEYEQLAADLGKSPAAVKMDVSRLRARYAVLLREVVAETVADPSEVESEIRHLLKLLSA